MQTPDTVETLKRFEEGLDLVDTVAAQLLRAVKAFVEYDDLVSLGREGLLYAARHFDPNRGASFRTYATYRVRGAILDGVRRIGPIPRKTYERLFAMSRASSTGHGNAEEERRDEPALANGDPEAEAELRAHLPGAISAVTLAITSARLERELAARAEEAHVDPEEALGNAQLLALLRRTVDALEPEESQIIHRHYFEDQSLEEIAPQMQISSSWASRLHTRAVASLTKRLRRTGEP